MRGEEKHDQRQKREPLPFSPFSPDCLSFSSGHFTILNCNEAGFKQEVVTGLKLTDDDQPSLKRYAKAQKRQQFEQARENSHHHG